MEEKLDKLLLWAEEQSKWNEKQRQSYGEQKHWNEKHDQQIEKLIQKWEKLYQWIEKLSIEIEVVKKNLHEFKLYQFQKNDELFEIVIEMRDDLKILKSLVGVHDDSIKEFRKHTEDKSRHLNP